MPDRIRMRDLLDPAPWEALDRWRDSSPYHDLTVQTSGRQVTLILSGLYGSSVQRLVTDRVPRPDEPQNWADVVRRALDEVDGHERRAAEARAAARERMELERASSTERARADHERDEREVEL